MKLAVAATDYRYSDGPTALAASDPTWTLGAAGDVGNICNYLQLTVHALEI